MHPPNIDSEPKDDLNQRTKHNGSNFRKVESKSNRKVSFSISSRSQTSQNPLKDSVPQLNQKQSLTDTYSDARPSIDVNKKQRPNLESSTDTNNLTCSQSIYLRNCELKDKMVHTLHRMANVLDSIVIPEPKRGLAPKTQDSLLENIPHCQQKRANQSIPKNNPTMNEYDYQPFYHYYPYKTAVKYNYDMGRHYSYDRSYIHPWTHNYNLAYYHHFISPKYRYPYWHYNLYNYPFYSYY